MDPSGRHLRNLLWLALIVSVTAAIPVVVYLTLTHQRPRPEPTRAPGATVTEDLERLGDSEPLYRDAVTASIGEQTLIEAVDLRKQAGEEVATARVMALHVAPFFSARKEGLDSTWTEVFSALPPGTTAIASTRTTIVLGEANGKPVSLPEMEARVSHEEGSVRVTGEWQAGDRSCAAELVYTMHRGLLFVRYDCPGSHYPAAFLPADEELWLDTLSITSGSYLEINGLRLASGEGGEGIFETERLVFSARAPVDRALFGSGLAAERLQQERSWKLDLAKVRSSTADLSSVPPFGGMQELPTIDFAADSVAMDSSGSISFVSPVVNWAGVGTFAAKTVDYTTNGAVLRLGIIEPSLEDARWGITVTAPDAVVERSAQSGFRVEVDSFVVGLPRNPLRLAALLKEAGEWKQQVKGIGKKALELPSLALPGNLPDGIIKLSKGTVSLPFGSGARVTDVAVDVEVRGGMIERLTAGLCVGGKECSEFGLKVDLRTDAVGRPEEATGHVWGARSAQLLKDQMPGMVQGLGNSDVDCTLTAGGTSGTYKVACVVSLADLTVFHKRLADNPFTFKHLRVEGEGLLDPQQKTLELSLPKLQLGGVYFRVSLDVGRYDALPLVKLKVDMPEQSCAALLRAVPERFAPHLQDARLTGSVWFNLLFDVDLMDVRKSIKLEVDGDLDRCDAVTLGAGYDVAALNRDDYVHRVVVHGEDLGIDVGPGVAGYIPLRYIPKVVQAAAYGTEDLAFFKHNGFRVGLIRRAIILYLERGYYAYGGSTISQQLVKNLFLTRDKTLSRKFEEAVIVWKMEKEVSKERIFELYLNCIEYGPKIWGIANAARVYFGKQPAQLHGMEAAFIMGLKPDPGYGYLQYRRGKLNKHWRTNLERVVKRLYDMGAISFQQYDLYMRSRLRFRLPGGAPAADPDENRPVRPGQEEFEEI